MDSCPICEGRGRRWEWLRCEECFGTGKKNAPKLEIEILRSLLNMYMLITLLEKGTRELSAFFNEEARKHGYDNWKHAFKCLAGEEL